MHEHINEVYYQDISMLFADAIHIDLIYTGAALLPADGSCTTVRSAPREEGRKHLGRNINKLMPRANPPLCNCSHFFGKVH